MSDHSPLCLVFTVGFHDEQEFSLFNSKSVCVIAIKSNAIFRASNKGAADTAGTISVLPRNLKSFVLSAIFLGKTDLAPASPLLLAVFFVFFKCFCF